MHCPGDVVAGPCQSSLSVPHYPTSFFSSKMKTHCSNGFIVETVGRKIQVSGPDTITREFGITIFAEALSGILSVEHPSVWPAALVAALHEFWQEHPSIVSQEFVNSARIRVL